MSGSGGPTDTASPTLRWVAFVTGYTPNDDYAPIESEGVGPDLLAEVKDVCVAFHPHNEVRLFPTRHPVYLFWCARTTGEYVVTRVSLATNTTGVRKTLDYFSVLLPPVDFARIGNDPFRTRELALHDHVRERLSAGERSRVDIRGVSAVAETVPDASRTAPPGLPRFLSGGEHAPTMETLRELEQYCLQASRAGGIPLTFATWWESGKRVPDGYFEIVMRVRPPHHNSLSLKGAEEGAVALAADILAVLPRNGRDMENERFHRALGGFVSGLIAALRSAEHLTSEEFRRAMADSAERIHTIGGKILSVGQATAVEDAARLEGLSRRCDQFAADLPRLQHPKLPGNWRSGKVQVMNPVRPLPREEANGVSARRSKGPAAPSFPTAAVGMDAAPRVAAARDRVSRKRARRRGSVVGGVILVTVIVALLATMAWYWQRQSVPVMEPTPASSPAAPSPATPGPSTEPGTQSLPGDSIVP
jgi:hypothetical protein